MSQQVGTHPYYAKLQQAQNPTWRNCLIYGPSRAGKTTFLGSAAEDPRTAPTIVLDFEGGGASLFGSKATVVPIKDWQDFTDVYEFLGNADHGFRSLGIDSLSETHIHSILGIVEEAYERGEKKENGQIRRKDDLSVEQSDYGKSMVQMRRLLRPFRMLPMHSFYTALTKSELEPKEGWVKKPFLFGQMADEVLGMFDTAAYLTAAKVGKGETERIKRMLILQNFPGVRAGARIPWGKIIPDTLDIDFDNGVTKLFDVLSVPKP